MKIIKIISANKKTKRRYHQGAIAPDGYKSKIGYAEAIVEEDGKLKTKHMVKIENE